MTASLSRCTSSVRREMRMMAMAKSSGKTRPRAASAFTRPERWMAPVSTTVATPATAAPKISQGELRSASMPGSAASTRKASTMPSSTVWLMASVVIESLRNSRNVPGNAAARATSAPVSSAVVCGSPSSAFSCCTSVTRSSRPINSCSSASMPQSCASGSISRRSMADAGKSSSMRRCGSSSTAGRPSSSPYWR